LFLTGHFPTGRRNNNVDYQLVAPVPLTPALSSRRGGMVVSLKHIVSFPLPDARLAGTLAPPIVIVANLI